MTDRFISNGGNGDAAPGASLAQSEHKFLDISPGLQATLQNIVDDVVATLNCVGAMVATLEANNSLPVRAYAVKVAPEIIKQLEARLGISFVGPKSVAYLDDKKFKDNLSVRAIRGSNGRPQPYLISNSLYDLFRPVVNKPLSFVAQQTTNIKQVIAVPFYLEDEVVGNLFAAARTQFSASDIAFLTALGHQAAIAIQSQRRLDEAQALESIMFDLQASLTDETRAFKIITDAVVDKLGYLAAAVAPRVGNSLPVRAYSVNSTLISLDFVDKWQRRLGFDILGDRAVAYLDRPDFADQLSVRAIRNGQAQTSDSLYDLVRPIIPRLPILTLQTLLGIKQVISIPFFLDEEVVGNLYVISQRPKFAARELEVLKAFGQHAAISIHNAQLYRKSENLRKTAQMFAKMAFSSAAYVHSLRNHIGVFRIYLQMIASQLDETFQKLEPDIQERLNQAATILDHLHEPWRQQTDQQLEVNKCVSQAIAKISPDPNLLRNRDKITIQTALADNLLPVYTSPEMLTEVFRILIKNAIEAIKEKAPENGYEGELWVKSYMGDESTVEVLVQDNGHGIRSENLNNIFELGWSTKAVGMGFGLFWAQDYVEGLGGKIKVHSVWREGTTFRVQLPAIRKQ
ncbi:MAG: GAF domain-containing sensor histidine kinase [Anaerolineae bacterium]